MLYTYLCTPLTKITILRIPSQYAASLVSRGREGVGRMREREREREREMSETANVRTDVRLIVF